MNKYILAISILASAQTFAANQFPVATATLVAAPEPLPTAKVLHIDELLSLWKAGRALTPSDLVGNWKAVAIASSSACKALAGEDEYSEAGLTNSDKSELLSLEIVNADISTGGLGPGADQAKPAVLVKIKGLGRKDLNQGPYVVASTEPQFSSFPTNGNQIGKAAYFEFSCRAIAGTTGQTICQIQPRLEKPTSNEKACMQSPGIAVGYKKVI